MCSLLLLGARVKIKWLICSSNGNISQWQRNLCCIIRANAFLASECSSPNVKIGLFAIGFGAKEDYEAVLNPFIRGASCSKDTFLQKG